MTWKPVTMLSSVSGLAQKLNITWFLGQGRHHGGELHRTLLLHCISDIFEFRWFVGINICECVKSGSMSWNSPSVTHQLSFHIHQLCNLFSAHRCQIGCSLSFLELAPLREWTEKYFNKRFTLFSIYASHNPSPYSLSSTCRYLLALSWWLTARASCISPEYMLNVRKTDSDAWGDWCRMEYQRGTSNN